MYTNVDTILRYSSIKEMELKPIIETFLESEDGKMRYVLGSKQTLSEYFSKTSVITAANRFVFTPDPPTKGFYIAAELIGKPEYKEGVDLFRKYVDVELFFTSLITHGSDYLIFMNYDTCVIVYVPDKRRIEISQLEAENEWLEAQLMEIPSWIRWLFLRKGDRK